MKKFLAIILVVSFTGATFAQNAPASKPAPAPTSKPAPGKTEDKGGKKHPHHHHSHPKAAAEKK